MRKQDKIWRKIKEGTLVGKRGQFEP